MKHVFIHAYLAGNLGDDLFVTMLCRRYPRVKFRILADASYRKRFQSIPNCRVYAETDRSVVKINRLLQKAGVTRGFWKLLVRSSRAVIHIGGSSFVQHFDDWSAFYGTDLYLAEKSRGLYLIGSNFGPYTDSGYLEAYKNLFRKYRGICFRDRQSFRLFSDIPQVSLAPDVVFGLRAVRAPRQQKVLIAPVDLESRTGRYDISMYHPAYFKFHRRLIRHFIHQGRRITLAGFCAPQGDGVIIHKLFQSLDDSEKQAVTCMIYDCNMDEMLREFAESTLVVGTRFHSIILGLISGCSVLPVIYDQKTANVLKDLGFPPRLQLSDLETFQTGDLENAWIRLSDPEIEKLRTEAGGQFRYTDMLFHRKG